MNTKQLSVQLHAWERFKKPQDVKVLSTTTSMYCAQNFLSFHLYKITNWLAFGLTKTITKISLKYTSWGPLLSNSPSFKLKDRAEKSRNIFPQSYKDLYDSHTMTELFRKMLSNTSFHSWNQMQVALTQKLRNTKIKPHYFIPSPSWLNCEFSIFSQHILKHLQSQSRNLPLITCPKSSSGVSPKKGTQPTRNS